MENCIFCKIIRGEIPTDFVYKDNEIMAFLDINPVSNGHVLIIPREHYKWMYDVPDKILSSIFIKTKKIMKYLKEKMKADFVIQAVVGTDVPHFHIHLLPRKFNDGLSNFWPTKKYKDGEAKKISERIKIDRL